jgi:exo-beta-1,3-glucanase (GH17 family)
MRKIILAITAILFLSFSSQTTAQDISKLIGLNYGPYTMTEQDPNKGILIGYQQIYDHISKLSLYTYWVRTFSCTNGLENIGPIAHSFGMRVIAGGWFGKDKNQNEIELDALISVCSKGHADIAVLGSETLQRGDLTGSELIGYINRFQQAVPGFPVVVADTYNALLANPDVVNASDAVMLNIYPFWDGIDISNAVFNLRGAYYSFKYHFPDKLIIIGETGWPSDGDITGAAVPSPINAAFYLCNVMSWARTENVIIFPFEAFDEPWKAAYEGPRGSHWGIWDKDGNLKQYMDYTFEGYILPSTYWK